MEHKIIKRKYYALTIELISPLKVSNGENIYSDSDVIRNGKEELFIPGSSLAGAFRNYLGYKKEKNCIMGFSHEKEGRMSSLFISDFYFDHQIENFPRVSLRDGVSLSKEKTVENKFDMEIIETGANGIMFLECIVRDEDSEKEFEQDIYGIFQGIQYGDIRFGSNKTRGFGRMKIIDIFQAEFDQKSLQLWIDFVPNRKDIKNSRYQKNSYEQWLQNYHVMEVKSKYIKIQIPLKLAGGISIRRYSAQPDKADFEHITYTDASGKEIPVIPGSSWNGAIRADVREILADLGLPERIQKELLGNWFGYVNTEKKAEKTAKSSQVVIAESTICNSVKLPITRNKINRFDASTKDGALYSELAYFGGNTVLEILVYKDRDKSYLALLGMLLLVIKDIQKGYVAVGGQTAVGRGIFEMDQTKEIVYSEKIDKKLCNNSLYKLIQDNGGVFE